MLLARRLLVALPLLLLSPLLILVPLLALAISDLLWHLFGRRGADVQRQPHYRAASVVIPNWNGRSLLEKYLPSVIEALAGNPQNEIIVVDNGSEDGSAEFVRSAFPSVKVVALPKNLGFGGGSNEGFRAATNDIVVLLNSDMRVDSGFLAPLLANFEDDRVFAVSCQIFFSDPAKAREETGLTQGWWQNGRLRVAHHIDDAVAQAFPCFYGGGGSCAFDRRKFLDLGGFDEIFRPFYLEDADLGYVAWKRGWKILYEPRSIVFHEHRGTIGKKFSHAYIDSVLHKNFLLFAWKNIHEWPRLGAQFAYVWADGFVSALFGDSLERANLYGLLRAFLQLPGALRSRWRARSLARISDSEAFRRPLGGHYRDRFAALPAVNDTPRVLFVSPYAMCPPIHGGGVFMYQTSKELSRLVELHLIVLVDYAHEIAPHQELVSRCASAEFMVRRTGDTHSFASITPHAISEFRDPKLEWLIHRQIFLKEIDVLQLEYLPLGQYLCEFQRLACVLFEHDVYFQSIGRLLKNMHGLLPRIQARFEYLRAIRYELRLLPRADRIQVCSRHNREFLASFRPELDSKIDDDLRAGIDTASYEFRTGGRKAQTMLFLGSFRHLPNQEGITWFTRYVMPHVLARNPDARLIVIGSDPPPRHALPGAGDAIELLGFVEDIRKPLLEYAVFVCPILSGSGVRVKLLEAFASGIPVVSTTIGAEGLVEEDGRICALADNPEEFALKIISLFEDQEAARAMAERARAEVVAHKDMRLITANLAASYRAELARKRSTASSAELRRRAAS